ncbi:hypothetical protein [Acidiphilium multivorum]|uniref:hypothetical protein n=1 Tax=Acidiphilium multivorum TaxID=62140 RepID=UPI001B8B3F13|nr:hypothetical protein [Acidiphilium multivorum]MBS3025433.1 hypothetical protein [Acidiphilium multivorum]
MSRLLTEAQLERLRELETRRQASEKLSPDERLELRRLRAEEKAAAAATELAKVANAEKRRLDRRRYEIGKLAIELGLENVPDHILRNGFAYLAGRLARTTNQSDPTNRETDPGSPPAPGAKSDGSLDDTAT